MPKLVPLVKYWAPVIAWMLLIFVASGDLMSAEHTSRFLVPLLLWLKPDISPEALTQIHFLFRKAGHVTEYAVLAMLLWRAIRQQANPPRARLWRDGVTVFLAAAIYASLDEFHQSHISSRSGSPWDVLIDCIGAMLGLAVCVLANLPKPGLRNPK